MEREVTFGRVEEGEGEKLPSEVVVVEREREVTFGRVEQARGKLPFRKRRSK